MDRRKLALLDIYKQTSGLLSSQILNPTNYLPDEGCAGSVVLSTGKLYAERWHVLSIDMVALTEHYGVSPHVLAIGRLRRKLLFYPIRDQDLSVRIRD